MYGICFALMNDKVPWLCQWLRRTPFRVEGKGAEVTTFFDRMLACPFCTGFHCGYIVWLLEVVRQGKGWDVWFWPSEMLMWAFASAAFCYVADTAVQWFEPNGE